MKYTFSIILVLLISLNVKATPGQLSSICKLDVKPYGSATLPCSTNAALSAMIIALYSVCIEFALLPLAHYEFRQFRNLPPPKDFLCRGCFARILLIAGASIFYWFLPYCADTNIL